MSVSAFLQPHNCRFLLDAGRTFVVLGLSGIIALTGLAGCAQSPVKRPSVADSVALLRSGGSIQSVVDGLCQPLVDSGRNVGIVVGVISKDSRAVFSYGKWSTDRLSAKKIDGDSMFLVGSPTKSFTAMLLETFVRDGTLAHDASVSSIPRSERFVKNKRVMATKLWHLASHISGFPREPIALSTVWSALRYQFGGQNFYDYITTESMLDEISGLNLDQTESFPYHYSNLGYSFLGWLLGNLDRKENVSALDNYKRLEIERVLLPLGLRDTVFDLSADQEKRLVTGHSGVLPPLWQRNRKIADWHVQDAMWPAGGLYSSTNDLLNLLAVNLDLNKSNFTEVLRAGEIPRSPTKKGFVGAGWFIDPLPSSRHQVIYADGISAGYTSFVGMDAGYRFGVVVLENNIDFDDLVGKTLLDRLVAAVD